MLADAEEESPMFSETTGTPGVLLFLAVMTLMIVLRRFFFKEDEEEEREDEDEWPFPSLVWRPLWPCSPGTCGAATEGSATSEP